MLLDWRPEGKHFRNYLEEYSFMKFVSLNINSQLLQPDQGKVTKKKVDYFIMLSEVVNLKIDYHTVDT